MCPEYGATVAIFPVDDMTLDYLRLTGRDEAQVQLVEHYTKEQGLFRVDGAPDAIYSETIELDLASIEPSLAGPKRPQDRVSLKKAKVAFQTALPDDAGAGKGSEGRERGRERRETTARWPWPIPRSDGLDHGAVVIAAITSCTNTSNPA